MQQLQATPVLAREIRFAGLLYLVIIVAGLSAELLLRGPLGDLHARGCQRLFCRLVWQEEGSHCIRPSDDERNSGSRG